MRFDTLKKVRRGDPITAKGWNELQQLLVMANLQGGFVGVGGAFFRQLKGRFLWKYFKTDGSVTLNAGNGSYVSANMCDDAVGSNEDTSYNVNLYLHRNGSSEDPAVPDDSVLAGWYDRDNDRWVAFDLPVDLSGVAGVPTGAILPFGGDTAPSGYELCDGASYSTTGAKAALFAVIGYAYGGSGANFNVPTSGDRSPVGYVGDTGVWTTLGATGGVASYDLSHTHLQGEKCWVDQNSAMVEYWKADVASSLPTWSAPDSPSISPDSSDIINNYHPCFCTEFIIKT